MSLAVGIWILGSQFTADDVLGVEIAVERGGKVGIPNTTNRNPVRDRYGLIEITHGLAVLKFSKKVIDAVLDCGVQ